MREHELKMFLKKCDGDDVPLLVNEIVRLKKIINPTPKPSLIASDEQVKEMRAMFKDNYRVIQIAQKFGVSYHYAHGIVNNLTRKNI